MERLFPGLSDLAVPGDDPRFFSKYFINVFADYKNEDVPIKPDAMQIFLARANPLARTIPRLTACLRVSRWEICFPCHADSFICRTCW